MKSPGRIRLKSPVVSSNLPREGIGDSRRQRRLSFLIRRNFANRDVMGEMLAKPCKLVVIAQPDIRFDKTTVDGVGAFGKAAAKAASQ